ncbi:hypothetical protein DD985_22860 [Pseudomonas sp. HMWF011]|nr:hypothetical protein DD985_22860 [Pseudomonas sp. HMWF011]
MQADLPRQWSARCASEHMLDPEQQLKQTEMGGSRCVNDGAWSLPHRRKHSMGVQHELGPFFMPCKINGLRTLTQRTLGNP